MGTSANRIFSFSISPVRVSSSALHFLSSSNSLVISQCVAISNSSLKPCNSSFACRWGRGCGDRVDGMEDERNGGDENRVRIQSGGNEVG